MIFNKNEEDRQNHSSGWTRTGRERVRKPIGGLA